MSPLSRVEPTATPALGEDEIEAIVARLRQGEPLDDRYRARLFREPKESELVYAGKESRGAILAQTMGVPIQTLKRFGDSSGGWANKLIFGDNLQVLKTLFEMKERGLLKNGDGSTGVRLCYIDPPFATRQEFRGGQGQRAYQDKVEGARFIESLRKRLVFIRELLSDDGTLYVHLDPKKGHYIKVVLDEIFGPENFRNEIIWWYYNKMQGNIDRFPSNHDCIYAYSRNPHPLFNTLYEERAEPSRLIKRAWDSQKSRLVNVKGPDGKVVYIVRDDRRIDDVWRISMLQPADKTEKVDYPTQKPETLLALVIAASSKKDDLVLDAYAGSGTTAIVAETLGRRWIGIDSGKFAMYTAQKRLLELTKERGRRKKTYELRPFELGTAGLYDNALLEQLPYEKFEEFCLDLFQCRAQPHSIGGVPMAGTRRGAPVHFFPFHKTDGVMGRAYVESLHNRVGSKVSGSVCVVAPVSACDPGLFEDIVEVGGVSYFILRVPYSVIEALHERRFEHLDQARSLDELNEAFDSFGFDFVQLPEVEARYTVVENALRVEIASFARGGLDPEELAELEDAGRRDLAMVMVDDRYDGEIFRVSSYFFADALSAEGWAFEVVLPSLNNQVVLIYLDTHGNERREIVEPSRLTMTARLTRGGHEEPIAR